MIDVEMAAGLAVPVLCDAVKVADAALQKATVPVHVRTIERAEVAGVLGAVFAGQVPVLKHEAGGNEGDGWIDSSHRFCKFVVLDHEVLQIGAANLPRSPRLVADVPKLYVVRLGMAITSALSAHFGVDRSVHVFNLLGGRVRVAQAGVNADVRLDADEPAKRHELIHAEIVGLHGAPGVIPVGRALIAIANGVVPDEVRSVVAAIAPEAGLDLADQRNSVGAEAFDVAGGHERKRADVEVARAGAGDLERGI